MKHEETHNESPNEFLLTRRTALGAGLGAMLVPVTGLLSPALAASPPVKDVIALTDRLAKFDVCMVATQAVEGPYYLDKAIVRADIRDGQTGRVLRLNLKIVDANNFCRPVEGALVSIWHCNALGEYSAYLDSDPNKLPPMEKADRRGHMAETTPERFLRGAQVADKEGNVSFTTIYPGWYTPRVPHIHVRVYLSDRQLITTQLYFPQALTDVILTTDEIYKTRGASIYTNENDLVRRQTGITGLRDVLGIAHNDDGSLTANRTLGASYI